MEQVIDDFNQMLEDYRSKEGHPLSEDKKSEYRDLRRRGKNRVSIITYQTTLLSLVNIYALNCISFFNGSLQYSVLFQVAARDSREKKILKTGDLKRRKQYLRQRLSRTLNLVTANAKIRMKKEALLKKAIKENKLDLLNRFTSSFPQDIYSSHNLPVPGIIT